MYRWIGTLAILAGVTAGGVGCKKPTRPDDGGSSVVTPAPDAGTPAGDAGAPTPDVDPPPTVDATPVTAAADETYDIADHAFPPTLSDAEWHEDAWYKNDCLRCHETGVEAAPILQHRGMPNVLTPAKCRTCHVLIPGSKPIAPKPPSGEEALFADNAFPPMIPNSGSHPAAWMKDDCLMCHETGIRDAPVTKHEGMPRILFTAKCRTCHVQVRAGDVPPP